MPYPLVSIMMTTFNHANFVAEAISSALEQDYETLELVVADDGSTDGTIEIVLDYAERYPHFLKAIVHGPHLGLTGNCNRALKACQGKYIAFHSGDDVFLPGKIRAQVEWMEADDRRVLCGHDVDVFDSKTGRTLYIYGPFRGLTQGTGADAWIKYGCIFSAQAIMVRSRSLPCHGFDERVHVSSDWFLWIECLAGGGLFGSIRGVYSRYRRHGGNITSTDIAQVSLEDSLVILGLIESRYPELFESCVRRRRELLLQRGVQSLRKGNTTAARRYFRNSFRTSWGLKPIAWLGFSVLPLSVRHALRSLRSWIRAYTMSAY